MMPPGSPPAAVPAPDIPAPAEPPGVVELFLAFAKISLSGFGGVLVFARRAIVEKYRWMSADEFNETYALPPFLPGPNICNLSVVFGARIRGIPGSFAAFTGLVGPPVVLVSILATIYARDGEVPALQRTLAGVSGWGSNGGPAGEAPRPGRSRLHGRGICGYRLVAAAAAAGSSHCDSLEH